MTRQPRPAARILTHMADRLDHTPDQPLYETALHDTHAQAIKDLAISGTAIKVSWDAIPTPRAHTHAEQAAILRTLARGL